MNQTLRFPYQYLRGRYSPVVRVALFHDHAQTADRAYVDSGATYSIFDPEIAERLGINLRSGKTASVVSLEGQSFPVYLHPVGLRIGEFHIRAEIGFSEHLRIGFNLLGRHSVFDQLQFCFNDRAHELTLTRLDA